MELFVKQGIEATTTKQIAEASGVAEGTLYRHFKSKDEMAYTVFLTHLEAFSREMEKAAEPLPHTRDKLRALITCYFRFFETERTLFEYILAAEHRELRNYPITLRQPLHVVMNVVEHGIKTGELPDQDVTFAAAYIIGMVHRVSVFRSYGRIKGSLIHHVDRVTAACWRVVAEGAGHGS